MRAAIYVRVSTDEQAASADAQEVGARAWCESKGAQVVSVYRDEGVSGAEWERRPGLLSLRADVAASPRPWDVLVVRDLDRLGRDALRLGLLVEDLHDAGARCVAWSTGEEIQADPMARAVLVLRGVLAEQERAMIAHRTRVALEARARQGYVVGGAVYGYRGERGDDGVRYVIEPIEADVVRSIYERAAAGESVRTIAHALNRAGVASPRAGRRGTGSWSTSEVLTILRSERYRGVVSWGAVGAKYRRGTRVVTKGEPTVTYQEEGLRIVPDELWQAAQVRTPSALAAQGRNPAMARTPKHLLIGLATCGLCGGPIASARTANGKGERRTIVPAYTCGWHRDRGDAVCTARWYRPTSRLDAAVLSWLTGDVLSKEAIAEAVAEARRLATDTTPDPKVTALGAEERELAAQVARLTQAITLGAGDVESLVRTLTERDRRLKEVRAAISASTAPAPVIPFDLGPRLERAAAHLVETLSADVASAREILSTVLVGRVTVTPVDDDGRVRLRLTGEANPGSLLSQIVTTGGTREPVATPTGPERFPGSPAGWPPLAKVV